jgi:hypothetical protein
MTELSASPLMVALVKAATNFPFFVLAVPAGALADIVDRRRLVLEERTRRQQQQKRKAVARRLETPPAGHLLADDVGRDYLRPMSDEYSIPEYDLE